MERDCDDRPTPDHLVPTSLSKPAALRVVREITGNEDDVIPLPHCKKRMAQRHINLTQIVHVIMAGFIDGDPWFDGAHANWRLTTRALSAGTQITIEVAIEWKTRLLVVTVF